MEAEKAEGVWCSDGSNTVCRRLATLKAALLRLLMRVVMSSQLTLCVS